jgi:hypothetical protein
LKSTSIALLLIAVITFTVVSTLSTSAKSSNLCDSCHSNYYQYLDILENNSGQQLPTSIKVGETKTFTIVIQNQCNTKSHTSLTNVRVILSSKNGFLKIDASTYNIGTMGIGTKTATWKVTGTSQGSDELVITAQGINTHNQLTFSDTYTPNTQIVVNPTVTIQNYTVTISTKDSTNLVILTGVDVALNGVHKLTAQNGVTSFSISPGTYTIEIMKTGYLSTSEIITVTANTTLSRSLTKIPKNSYPIIISVIDNYSNPIKGANITISDFQKITDQKGKALFDLLNGTHTIKIAQNGYIPLIDTLSVTGPATLTKTLAPAPPQTYTINVKVSDSETYTSITGAKITLDGRTQLTNLTGSTYYIIQSGTYSLKITKEGYIPLNENITITSDLELERSLISEKTTDTPSIMLFIHPPIAIIAYLILFTFTTLLFVNSEKTAILVRVGFYAWILSLIGMFTGMLWAQDAWGSFWSWEPREITTLVLTLTISFMMVTYLENKVILTKTLSVVSCLIIIYAMQNYFLIAGLLSLLIIIAMRWETYAAMEKTKRYAELIKLNRSLSWVFIGVSFVTLGAGYLLTRLGFDPAISRPIHTYLGYAFTALLMAHIFLSLTYPYPWKGYLKSFLHKITINSTATFIQESSAIILILVSLSQVITGLSWLNVTLASLIPLRLHVNLDNILLNILVIHGAIGIRAATKRRKLSIPGGETIFLFLTVTIIIIILYFQYYTKSI